MYSESDNLSRAIIYVTAYPQLKELFDQTFGSQKECVLIDYPFEEGLPVETLRLPEGDKIVLLLPHDIRSHLALYYLAQNFQGDIDVVYINGQYTDIAPLAISSEELKCCSSLSHKLKDERRNEIRDRLLKLQAFRNCFFKLEGDNIVPLPRAKVHDFILTFLSGEQRIDHIVGRCMGNAPKGWPITDVFYLNRIEELIANGDLVVTNDKANPFKKYIKLR